MSASGPLWAGNSLFQGSVLEKGNKVPVLGAGLYLEKVMASATPAATASVLVSMDSTHSTTPTLPSPTPSILSIQADLKGKFQVPLEEGTYCLTLVAAGYLKAGPITLEVHQDVTRDFFMERDGFSLPEVVVSGSRDPVKRVSHEVLTRDELKSVPGTAGDVLRALQTLPGVAVAGDFSGQLLVRGGGPQDNLYLVDRIPLAFPFHFGGVLSTVNSDLIKDVDFSAGGFGPQYGNYWGGVVDITQRDARRDRWGFRGEVNMLLSEGLVEGPLTTDSSLVVAGRRSYLELFSGVFANTNLTALPAFGDYQAKFSLEHSRRTHWDLQAFGSDDHLGINISPDSGLAQQDPAYAGTFEFHNGYHSQGLNYRRLCDGENTLLATLYHTDFFFDTHLGRDLHLTIDFQDFGGRFDWLHDFDEDTHLRIGLEVDHTVTGNHSYFVQIPQEGDPNFDLTSATRYQADSSVEADNLGFYAEQKFHALEGKLEMAAGLRGDLLDYNGHFTGGPRLSAAYGLAPGTILKASYGWYFQLPWQGPYLDRDFGNPALLSEKAISSILGVEQDLGGGLILRLEAYQKDLTDVVVGDTLLRYSNNGTGTSRGLEFFLRRPSTERFFGWLSYALSESVRHNSDSETHVYDYDQPHIATLVMGYKLDPGWDIGLKWRFSSGTPYSPVVDSVFDYANGRFLPIYGAINSARLPDYHRLDLSTSLSTAYDTWEWRVYLEVMNVYDHKNVFAYDYNSDYSQRLEIFQLPFLPYLGFEVKY